MLRPIVAISIANIRTGKKESVYAILDSGADRDYVGINLAQRLGLEMEQKELELTFIDTTSKGRRNTASIKLGNLSGSYQIEVRDVIVGDFASGKDEIPPSQKSWEEFDHLRDLEFIDIDAKVEVLLSTAHLALWFEKTPRRGLRSQAIGLGTVFGWTVAASERRNCQALDLPLSSNRRRRTKFVAS